MPDTPVISTSSLAKSYRVHRKEPGLWGSVKALFKRNYELVPAVAGISFEVQQGELVGFLGPNGAGKTTTLKMLSGLLYPTGGEARVLGYTPAKRDHAFLRQISLVMGQKAQLWWDLPAADGFLLNQEIYRLDKQAAKRTASELAEWLGVSDKLHVQVRKLSLGERMKVELIAALLHKPRVLFLDEPTIGLDVTSQRRIRQFIREYNQRERTTILLTSHYMADVEELCERVVVIGAGKLLLDGKLKDAAARFSTHKMVTLDFPASRMPPREVFAAIATVEKHEAPQVRLRVPREQTAAALKRLAELDPLDLIVDDVPIEDVIEGIYAGNSTANTGGVQA